MENFAELNAEATWNPKWRNTKKPRADRGRCAIDGWFIEKNPDKKARTNGKGRRRSFRAEAIQGLMFLF